MFLIDKYTPKSIEDVKFHKDIIDMLKIMSEDDSIPHLILYGPEGSGKKTIMKLLLEMMYDKSINKLDDITYKVCGSGNKATEVIVKQSNYHIIIEPNNNNFDRYLIQDIVKEYARRKPLNVFSVKKEFKTVLINNVDNLSYYAQTSLRRMMEQYSHTCRFIMVCRSLSRVIEPLCSRCICVRVNSPSDGEMFKIVYDVSTKEKMNLDLETYTNIIENARGNIKIALWQLQNCQYNLGKKKQYFETAYHDTINDIVNLILELELEKIIDIRNLVYNIMITNIDGTQIMRDLLLKLCANTKIPDVCKYYIIEACANYEHNLVRGRREILHIEGFITYVMMILDKHKK
jgi:replication factor C subunit 3/5